MDEPTLAKANKANESHILKGKADELQRVMFDTAPIGLTIFDSNCIFIESNETVLSMFGVTKEYYTDHFYELSPEYQPDGSKSVDKTLELMGRALNGETITVNWMHCTPDGTPIPCEVTLTRARYKGIFVGVAYVYDLRHIKMLVDNIQWLEAEVDKMFFATQIDALTGIYNRRYFDQNIKTIISGLSRSNGKLSFIMVDIDHFKEYNDTYGHSQGDICLKEVAETLSKSLQRTSDFAVRYGGEEFAVILPNTDESGVVKIADKLLENIRQLNLKHEKSAAADRVTVSIGATTGLADYKQTGEEYVKRADEMLYKSKQTGRNKASFKILDPTV